VKKQNPDGTVAVDGLNLDVPDGKTMILVGRGDCGKTARCARSAGWSSRPKAGSTWTAATYGSRARPAAVEDRLRDPGDRARPGQYGCHQHLSAHCDSV